MLDHFIFSVIQAGKKEKVNGMQGSAGSWDPNLITIIPSHPDASR